MAIVTKGSGGSIKLTGTGGGIRVSSSGDGGGGGGGGTPDSSNLYSLLRRGVNQTTTTNDLSETVVASWTDARGMGSGYPKYVPQAAFAGTPKGVVLNPDGSAQYGTNTISPGYRATGLIATVDDSDTSLGNSTNESWTVYARIKPQESSFLFGELQPIYTIPFSLEGNTALAASPSDSYIKLICGWRLVGEHLDGGSFNPIMDENVASQYLVTPQEYQVVVIRGTPGTGWSFRISNSSVGPGSFGTSYNYTRNNDATSYPLSIGSAIHIGSLRNGGTSQGFAISDFAIYKSYHNDSTATQVINYLTAAP